MTPTSRVSRSALEKWASSKGLSTEIYDRRESGYRHKSTQYAWEGWQAALSTMGDVVPAIELERLIESWSDANYFSDVTPELVRDTHVYDLSAILNRGGK